MKINILVIIFLMNFSSAFAEDTAIKNDMCKGLANKVSFEAFSDQANKQNYEANDLNDEQGLKYISAVKTSLAKQMNDLCDAQIDKVSITDFQNEYHATCPSNCQTSKKIFTGLLSNSQKDKANLACMTVCNDSYRKLALVEKGIKLAAAQEPQAPSASCGNAVSNVSKNAVKSVESNTTTTKAVKKATGK